LYFILPGGKIEAGETPEQTIERETLEETGYSIKAICEQQIFAKYDFEWNHQINDCETHFIVGKLLPVDSKPVLDADYHRGVDWVPVEKITEVFAYSEPILQSIKFLIDSQVT
jgi:tRNA(adenine34) deaminase